MVEAERVCPELKTVRVQVARMEATFLVDGRPWQPFDSQAATNAHIAEIWPLANPHVPRGRTQGRWNSRIPAALTIAQPRSTEDLWPVTEIVVHFCNRAPHRGQLLFNQDLAVFKAQLCSQLGLPMTCTLRIPTHCPAETGCPLHLLVCERADFDPWNDSPEAPPDLVYGLLDLRRLVAPPRPGYLVLQLPDLFDLAWLRHQLHTLMPEQPQICAAFMGTEPILGYCSPDGPTPLITIFPRGQCHNMAPALIHAILEASSLTALRSGNMRVPICVTRRRPLPPPALESRGTMHPFLLARGYPAVLPMLLSSTPDDDEADHESEDVLVLCPASTPVMCAIPRLSSPAAFVACAARCVGLDASSALHVPTFCPLQAGHLVMAIVIPGNIATERRFLVVDARRVCGSNAPPIWLQESPRVLNPVIAIAMLRSAQPALGEIGAFYLDCAPMRGYVELTTRVSVLTLMPATFAMQSLPALLQNSRAVRRRPGFAQLYCRYVPPRHGTTATSTSTTTTAMAPNPDRGVQAKYLFDKPVRLYICSPNRHVEVATLHGELDLEDVMAQLCIQMADANQLRPGWTFRASERVVSDTDFGFSAFMITLDTTYVETAWVDARRLGMEPFAIPLPCVLTIDVLAHLCGRPLPDSCCVAVNGVPWAWQPHPLQHTDVVVIASQPHELWTMPLAALEKRINGISCLIIHQKGPYLTARMVAFADQTNSGSGRRVFCFSGIRNHWALIRLAWQTETCVTGHSTRCILVAADVPPIPVAGGNVAPTATDVNFWYQSRFSQLFGGRTWCESGLAFGDFAVFFDSALDATSRRPWIIDLGEAVDVVIAGSDGTGLDSWPAPEGWAIRPALITGPIGQAAIQRQEGGVPTIVRQPLPGEHPVETVEIASASSDDDIEVINARPAASSSGHERPAADPTTVAYLQSLVDNPPTQEAALAQAEVAEGLWHDPNPFLQSIVDNPPTLQEVLSQFGNEAVSSEDDESPARSLHLLQLAAHMDHPAKSAPHSGLHDKKGVGDTIPQTDVPALVRKLPTPCRRQNGRVQQQMVSRSQARDAAPVETLLVREVPAPPPSCDHSAACPCSSVRRIALQDLLPAGPSMPESARLHTHANVDEFLTWMEPFGLQAFRLDIMAVPGLHVATRAALEHMPVWDSQRALHPHGVDLFVDGSYFDSSGEAAWAVVAIVHSATEAHWGGFLSGRLHGASEPLYVGQTVNSPHTAELVALLYALVTAVRLPNVRCRVFYDATAAAGIAEARFTSRHERVLMHALFNLLYLARQEAATLDFTHVHSHQGHAFNEAADAVAKAVVQHGICHEPAAQQFARAIRQSQLDWVWWTTGPQVSRGFCRGCKMTVLLTLPLLCCPDSISSLMCPASLPLSLLPINVKLFQQPGV